MSRRIDDAGEKIGGARKDWRHRSMDVADLADMTNNEAIEHVRKDNVWPQPNWAEVVAGGMPRDVAAHVKIIRDRLAQSPNFRRGAASPERVRGGFVRMTAMLRDTLMACRTKEDVKAVYQTILHRMGGTDAVRAPGDDGDAFFSVYAHRHVPFAVTPSDLRKASQMLAEGFPEKVPAWRKGVRMMPTADGGVVLFKSGRRIGPSLPDANSAWKWLEENVTSRTRDGGSSGIVPRERPHLDHLERYGLTDHRGGNDVSPEDFIAAFGFRGVEFGLWLPDDERQRVLNLSYDSLMDLAEVLDWNCRSLSLDGSLAVAFGARGKGSHAAHYEPGRHVINMTRLRGAGTIAHEYAHAVDYWAGAADSDDPATREMRAGTGGDVRLSDLRRHLANLTGDEATAWAGMVDLLFEQPLTPEEAAMIWSRRANTLRTQVDVLEARRAVLLTSPATSIVRMELGERDKEIKAKRDAIVLLTKRIEDANGGKLPDNLAPAITSYAKEARKLCGSSGEYWLRPTEMFARAFESWVFDRICAMNAQSDYLVHGVEEDRYASERYKGNPYPQGRERVAIGEAMTALTQAMKPRVERSFDADEGIRPGR